MAEKDINLFQDDVPLGAESFVADCCSAYLEGLADFEFSAMNRKDDRYELVVDGDGEIDRDSIVSRCQKPSFC